MLADAQTEGDKRAAPVVQLCFPTEKIHEALYREAAETLGTGKDLPEGRVLTFARFAVTPSRQVGGRWQVPGLQYAF